MNLVQFYLDNEFAFAAVQLSLAMIGMGATLRLADFVEVARAPKGFSAGISLQMLGVPVLTLLFIALLQPAPGLAAGLALCAAVPGGTVSNIYTFLGRGRVALSIALTAVATIACMLTTPLVLEALIAEHMPASFVMPRAQIAREILYFLLIPLASGMLLLRFFPAIAAVASPWCIRGSLFVIALIIAGSLSAGRLDFAAFGLNNVLLVLGFVVVLAFASIAVPKLFRLPLADVTAIHIEITVRNINLGLLLKASLFTTAMGYAEDFANTALFTLLLFGGMTIFMGIGSAMVARRLSPPTAAPERESDLRPAEG